MKEITQTWYKIYTKEYKYLLSALLPIAVKSRSDMMFAVNEASRILENSNWSRLQKNLMYILQYLKSTKDKSIYYNKNRKFIGYSDFIFFFKW